MCEILDQIENRRIQKGMEIMRAEKDAVIAEKEASRWNYFVSEEEQENIPQGGVAEMMKLPIGEEFFGNIRTKGFYYVDKTRFIADLLKNRGSVNLFTRPRRFGKSLNLDMLKTFFEIGTDAALFEGLEIEKEAELCERHMGKYPVIMISLKDVTGASYEEALKVMSRVIKTEARRHQYLLESNKLTEIDKESLRELYAKYLEEDVQQESIRLLSEMLNKHYGKGVIILIDEYDVPLDKAYQNHYYTQMVHFIRSVFSQALKTNKNLEFAVITGCLRIARESIFTGLNHFKIRGISDVECAEYFGFTDDEVRTMMEYYGVEDRFSDVKEWYDGYHFGAVDVYCPWDVINQCDKLRVKKDAVMEPHWENSSSNAIVQDILSEATETTKAEIEVLISGGYVEKQLLPELTYTDFDSADIDTRQTYLWSALFSSGYLTDQGETDGGYYRLVIPNREVLGIYEKKIRSWFKVKILGDTANWKKFCMAVRDGEAEIVEKILNKFMADSISSRDTFVKRPMKENYYHGMLFGLLKAEGRWIVKSNAESGTGYTDIKITIPAEKIGCVIELKYAEDGAFDFACREAMKQIEDGGYATALIQEGMQTIHKFGIACYKKTCKVIYSG